MAKKLYVGNLSWGTTEQALKDFFTSVGTVISATIITDHQTGRSRGFGFIEMENAEEAVHSLNGKEFQGRSIKVSEAAGRRPKSVGDYGHSGYGESETATGTDQW
jgi:RNA recognition motif-containing protein